MNVNSHIDTARKYEWLAMNAERSGHTIEANNYRSLSKQEELYAVQSFYNDKKRDATTNYVGPIYYYDENTLNDFKSSTRKEKIIFVSIFLGTIALLMSPYIIF